MSKRTNERVSYTYILGLLVPTVLYLIYVTMPPEAFALCSLAITSASFLLWRQSIANRGKAIRRPVYVKKSQPVHRSRHTERDRYS